MNWYKHILAENIGDLFQNPPEEKRPLQYPFNMVKKDTNEGWYIDDLPDIGGISIGDQVADDKLNDPDVLRLTIYKGRSVVGWGYYNREWIKPQKK